MCCDVKMAIEDISNSIRAEIHLKISLIELEISTNELKISLIELEISPIIIADISN